MRKNAKLSGSIIFMCVFLPPDKQNLLGNSDNKVTDEWMAK